VLRNLGFRQQVYTFVGVVTTGFVLTGALAWKTIDEVQVDGPITSTILRQRDLLADVLPPPAYIIEARLLSLEMLRAPDPEALRRDIEQMRVLREQYNTRHAHWTGLMETGPTRVALLDEAAVTAQQFFEVALGPYAAALQAGDRQAALTLEVEKLGPAYVAHDQAIRRGVVTLVAEASATEAQARAHVSTGLWLFGAASSLVVVASLAMAVAVARLTLARMHEVSDALGAVADKQLTVRLHVHDDGELGQISNSLNGALEGLSVSLGEVDQLAQELAERATRLTQTSGSIRAQAADSGQRADQAAEAAGTVNGTLQSVVSCTTEMSASIREIARHSEEARRISMEGVRAAEATNLCMSKLENSSAEINAVVKVISSVADQTNLLALNATIEAARAGEAGKGFAVVANEVKELAKQTSAATEQISARIQAIQQDSRAAMVAIVQIGDIIRTIHQAQESVATAVVQQDATTSEMTRSLATAASNMADIAQNVHELSGLLRRSSLASQEGLDSAERVASIASSLAAQARSFDIGEPAAAR